MAESLVLPANVRLHYLNEGAANIVYSISLPHGSRQCAKEILISTKTESFGYKKPETSLYANKLLRLRKNLPTSYPTHISQSNWINYIAPLFRHDEIVQQSLIAIKSSGIIPILNQELKEWERPFSHSGSSKRSKYRHGTYLADEDFGLLISDMTPIHKDQILIEFKPKWLTQSLSAPVSSVRCRQCARNARAKAESGNSGRLHPKITNFCPLDLLSDDEEVVTHLAYKILSPEVDQICVKRFVDWIRNFHLLHRLRELQIQFDRSGVLNADYVDKNFLTAMTLRDCTVFLRMSKDGGEIEARIGDLDLKSASKLSYWKQIEYQLIDGGWYEGTEDETHRQPNNCVLGRKK